MMQHRRLLSGVKSRLLIVWYATLNQRFLSEVRKNRLLTGGIKRIMIMSVYCRRRKCDAAGSTEERRIIWLSE